MRKVRNVIIGIFVIFLFVFLATYLSIDQIKETSVVSTSEEIYGLDEKAKEMFVAEEPQARPAEENLTESVKEEKLATEQTELTLEQKIEIALIAKFSNKKDPKFSVVVEMKSEKHAIGTYSYDFGERNKGDAVYFAVKKEGVWSISDFSYVGYGGSCSSFEKNQFPSNMTPDCWDEDRKILVDTSNPEFFYGNELTKKDKDEIVKAFVVYKKREEPERYKSFYQDKDLYLLIYKNTTNFVKGVILRGETENYSSGYILAVEEDEKWIVVYDGQDIPPCSLIKKYDFPPEIAQKCHDEAVYN